MSPGMLTLSKLFAILSVGGNHRGAFEKLDLLFPRFLTITLTVEALRYC